MGVNASKSLFEAIELLPSLDSPASRLVVPHNHSLYLEMALHAAEALERFHLEDAIVLMDAQTAQQVQAAESLASGT